MKTKQPHKQVVKLNKQVKHQAKLVFVPHKDNQYRPHLIRRYGLLVVLLLVVGIQISYNLATTGQVLGAKETISTAQLVDDTNSQRAQQGLPPLQLSDKLSQAAFLKGQDMLKQQYWAHVAPDGTTPWHWFEQVGYNYSYAGENLAKNFTSADAAMTAWMASPEHKANILDTHYTQVGFAVVDGTMQGKPISLIVALYGEPVATLASVAGTQTQVTDAPTTHSIGIVTRFGMAIQSMTPAALGSIVLILIVVAVAIVAHAYRKKLPKTLRQTWYRHHGLIKAGGMASLCLIVVFLYSGGQI